MNSVDAVDHLLVIVRTTVGRGFLFPLNGLTHGALLQAHFLDCFRLVSERGVVFPKGLGGFNGFLWVDQQVLALLLCVGDVE